MLRLHAVCRRSLRPSSWPHTAQRLTSNDAAAVIGAGPAPQEEARASGEPAAGDITVAPLRRRWNVASIGDVTGADLDALAQQFDAVKVAEDDAHRAPTAFTPPRPRRLSMRRMLRREQARDDLDARPDDRPVASFEHVADSVEAPDASRCAATDTSAGAEAEGTEEALAEYSANLVAATLTRAAHEQDALDAIAEAADVGSTFAPTAEAADVDNHDLRELARRHRAVRGRLSAPRGEELAAMDADAVADRAAELALIPADDFGFTDGGFKQRNPHKTHARSLEAAPKHLTIAGAAASLTEPRRFTEDELSSAESEATYHAVLDARVRQHEREKVDFAPMLAARRGSFDWHLQKDMMKLLRRYPVNHLITAATVILRGIWNPIAGEMVGFPGEDTTMPLTEARALANAHQLDLIQILHDTPRSLNDPGRAHVVIADAQSFAMDELEWHTSQSRINRAYETLEVGFTGTTDGHAIDFKSKAVAMWLAKRHPIKLVLRRFGTPREGFPFFEHLMGCVKAQADRMKVNYTAGKLRAEGKGSSSITCTLTPTSKRAPITTTTHPSQEDVKRAMDEAEYSRQYDINVTLPSEPAEATDRVRLRTMQRNGTLWAYRAEGLSLDKQRKLKAFQGALPKGDKDIYKARGDVNSRTFKTSSPTIADQELWPRESNLEQARRGATLLAMRHRMPLDEMVDKGETEGNTSVINRTHYSSTGNAFDVGRLKERLGLKRNRVKLPRRARGFATLGMDEPKGYNVGSDV